MTSVSIITRRLQENKTYDDFRRAWYHSVGFGTETKLFTLINVLDAREIIVIGFVDIQPGQDPAEILQIDVKERLDHPLGDVIEPNVGRTLGILVSEDDFSDAGVMQYRQASVKGKATDFNEIEMGLAIAGELMNRAKINLNKK